MFRKVNYYFTFLGYLIANEAMAEKVVGCSGNETAACISDPKGLLAIPKVTEGVQTANWILLSSGLVLGLYGLYGASVALNDERYKSAVGPGLGSLMGFGSMFIAYKAMN